MFIKNKKKSDTKVVKNNDKVIKKSQKKEEIKKKKESERKYNEKKKAFEEAFIEIVAEKNVCNSLDQTATLKNIEFINEHDADAVRCEVVFPRGVSKEMLDTCVDSFRQNLYKNGKSIVNITEDNNKCYLSAIRQFHNMKFKPMSFKDITPSMLFAGYTIDFKPIFFDFSKTPHMLISGSTGLGKSKLVEIMISNLAYNFSPKELELYFIQVSKEDNFKFEILKHCRGCVTTATEETSVEVKLQAINLLKYIDKQIEERGKLVRAKLGRISEDLNIHVYNKKVSEDKKLPVLMLWIDEATSLFADSKDKRIRDLSKEADTLVSHISQTGRYVGIYLINILQRASKEELSREIKTCTNVWLTFNQQDKGASMVAIGDEKAAIGLPKQVFAYRVCGGNISLGKCPFSSWSDNIKLIASKGYIRPDNDEIIRAEYNHWIKNICIPSDDDEEDNKMKLEIEEMKNKNKIVEKALEGATKKVNELANKCSQMASENKDLKTQNEDLKKQLKEVIEKREEKLENTEEVKEITSNNVPNKNKAIKNNFDMVTPQSINTSSFQMMAPKKNSSKKNIT